MSKQTFLGIGISGLLGLALFVELASAGDLTIKGHLIVESNLAAETISAGSLAGNGWGVTNLNPAVVDETLDSGLVLARSFGSPSLATLTNAIASIGSGNRALVLDGGIWHITDDVIIPSNISLSVSPGSGLDIAAGKTVTMGNVVTGGLYPLFQGDGTILLIPQTVQPEWWGAKGDGVTDDRPAIQKAMDAILAARAGELRLGGRSYLIDSFTDMVGSYQQSALTFWNSDPSVHCSIRIIGDPGARIITSREPSIETGGDASLMLSFFGFLQDVVVDGILFEHTHGYTMKQQMAIMVGGNEGQPLYDIKGVQVRNCRFVGFSREIALSYCETPQVLNCVFSHPAGRDSGSSTYEYPNVGVWLYGDSRGAILSGNMYDGCGTNDLGSTVNRVGTDGFLFGTCLGARIVNNVIRHFSYEGIYVGPLGEEGCVISGNLIDCGPILNTSMRPYMGIRCDQSHTIISDNNLINVSGEAGICVSGPNDVTITGNKLTMSLTYNSGDYAYTNKFMTGIFITGTRCLVSGNTIQWPGTPHITAPGLYDAYVCGIYANLSANYIIDNVIRASGVNVGSRMDGIFVNNLAADTLLENNLTENMTYSIYWNAPHAATIVRHHESRGDTHPYTGANTFNNMQGGSALLGTNSISSGVYTTAFPVVFGSVPKVICTPRCNSSALFMATVNRVSTNNFVVRIKRGDLDSGWDADLYVDWFAWE